MKYLTALSTSEPALLGASVSAVAGDAVTNHWLLPGSTPDTTSNLLSQVLGELKDRGKSTPETRILLPYGRRGHRSLAKTG